MNQIYCIWLESIAELKHSKQCTVYSVQCLVFTWINPINSVWMPTKWTDLFILNILSTSRIPSTLSLKVCFFFSSLFFMHVRNHCAPNPFIKNRRKKSTAMHIVFNGSCKLHCTHIKWMWKLCAQFRISNFIENNSAMKF